MSSDLEKLSAYVCPAGRLCECDHPAGEYSCPHCGCDCPFPDPYARSGDPDDCPCCGRHVP